MSALAATLRDMIVEEGPMPLERFMALALGHPQHGYYITRDPFGASGDFTTAPEISQMFGELIGLWAAEVWRLLGSPPSLRLVELGPGRGSLMADFLRAAQVVPEFASALDIHLVETSPVLREAQRQKLTGIANPVSWHVDLGNVPEGPAIFVANEFFDALPVRHYVQTPVGWRERLICIDQQDGFAFTLANEPERLIRTPAPQGTVLELGLVGQRVATSLASWLTRHGGAALIIDYGHAESGLGETLQAVRAHQFVSPFADPGEADLTAHVDFAALARAGRDEGVRTFGPVTQADFLHQLGIDHRAARLMQDATVAESAKIEAAYRRLVGDRADDMGVLFKVLAFGEPGLGALPGFEDVAT